MYSGENRGQSTPGSRTTANPGWSSIPGRLVARNLANGSITSGDQSWQALPRCGGPWARRSDAWSHTLDCTDRVLRPAIPLTDTRSDEHAGELESRSAFAAQDHGNLGVPDSRADNTLVSLTRTRHFKGTATVLLPKDYLRLH